MYLLQYVRFWNNHINIFNLFFSVRKKSVLDSEIQSLRKLKSKNDDYLKQLYKESYNIGAIFHITKFKTEELEEKIAEVRRKFRVCISVFFLVIKNNNNPESYRFNIDN